MTVSPPADLKLDRTKLKTVKSYASMKQVALKTVYAWMKIPGRLEIEEIDGVKFIRI